MLLRNVHHFQPLFIFSDAGTHRIFRRFANSLLQYFVV